MKTCNLLLLLGVMYGGQVVAAEAVQNSEQAAAADQQKAGKVKKHPKKCIEEGGKHCHPQTRKAAAEAGRQVKEVRPAAPEKKASTPDKADLGVVAGPGVAAAAAELRVEPVVPEAVALAMAKKNNCLVCHAVDRKMVGPGWRDVAAKYRGDAAAEAYLVNKIARGGGGVWGGMAMPAQPQVGGADRKILASYILNLH